MSFSIDNTSFISSVTELDEGVGTTGTIESTTILEESSGTDVVVLTDITKTYSNDAPFTTTYATATADKLTPYTLNSDVTITQEPTVTESSMISYTRPATDFSSSSSSSSYDRADSLSDASIAVLIVVGISLLIALITLCVTLKIQRKKRVVSPTWVIEKSISRHTLNVDTFYVDNSADYNSGATNTSFVFDKPEKTYYNYTLNATAMNTTPLFPPVHRSNQVYSISPPPRTSVIYRQELIHYGRESNQTMGRANGHESILMGSSVTTRQNSTCSSYHASLYSNNKQELHKMTLWDDRLIDAWSTDDKRLTNPSINGSL